MSEERRWPRVTGYAVGLLPCSGGLFAFTEEEAHPAFFHEKRRSALGSWAAVAACGIPSALGTILLVCEDFFGKFHCPLPVG